MQLHRSVNDRVLGGVCGGLAESLSVETIYIRLAFLVLVLYAGNGLLVYLLLWMILPKMESGDPDERRYRFFRSRTDNMVGGVCGGLSQALNTDVSIIRLIFIGLTIFAGGGIVVYLLLWLITPLEPADGI